MQVFNILHIGKHGAKSYKHKICEKAKIQKWYLRSAFMLCVNQLDADRRVNSTGNIYAEDLAEIKEQQSQILHQLLKLLEECQTRN